MVLAPLSDLQAQRRSEAGPALDPLRLLFLRIWLFGLMVGVFESVFYQATNALFFLVALSVFGLRFGAAGQVVAESPR
jgi:hypothetical protein